MTKEGRKTVNKVRRLYKACTGKALRKDLDLEQWLEAVDTIHDYVSPLREEFLQAMEDQLDV